ncbi:MAG: hypothetical protein H0T79_09035 [Deltaproteobacteria bacterium]|nr:hypothetical protein [Deltaproteobacteria bacterium]
MTDKDFPRLGARYVRTHGQGSSHELVDAPCARCGEHTVHYEGSEALDESDPSLPVYTALRDWFACTTCRTTWSEDRAF